jgi:regulator of replication initiation timing
LDQQQQALQQQHRIRYPTNHQIGRQSTLEKESPEALPPLQGTVTPWNAQHVTDNTEFLEDSTNMAQAISRLLSGIKPNKEGKICMSETNWNKILAHIKNLKDNVTDLTRENNDYARERKELYERCCHLEYELGKKSGKSKAKCRKHEARDDIKGPVTEYVKIVLFRNYKFAPPDEPLEDATKKVWAALKDGLQLDKGSEALTEDDFVEIYQHVVQSALSQRRQYVQTRAAVAAKSKFLD